MNISAEELEKLLELSTDVVNYARFPGEKGMYVSEKEVLTNRAVVEELDVLLQEIRKRNNAEES